MIFSWFQKGKKFFLSKFWYSSRHPKGCKMLELRAKSLNTVLCRACTAWRMHLSDLWVCGIDRARLDYPVTKKVCSETTWNLDFLWTGSFIGGFEPGWWKKKTPPLSCVNFAISTTLKWFSPNSCVRSPSKVLKWWNRHIYFCHFDNINVVSNNSLFKIAIGGSKIVKSTCLFLLFRQH